MDMSVLKNPPITKPKAQVLLIIETMALLYLSVPISNASDLACRIPRPRN